MIHQNTVPTFSLPSHPDNTTPGLPRGPLRPLGPRGPGGPTMVLFMAENEKNMCCLGCSCS